MGEVFKLIDGEIMVVLNLEDVLEKMDEYMGYEIRQYIERYIEELEEDKRLALTDQLEADQELQQIKEDHHHLLCDLKQEVEALERLTTADRLNRKQIQEAIQTIWDMIDREL